MEKLKIHSSILHQANFKFAYYLMIINKLAMIILARLFTLNNQVELLLFIKIIIIIFKWRYQKFIKLLYLKMRKGIKKKIELYFKDLYYFNITKMIF